PRHIDDRQGAVGRVLQQPRLARRLRPRRGAGRRLGAPYPRRTEIFGAGERAVTPNRAGAPFRICALVLGLAFLYAPILLLVLYSFNASRLVTVWAGSRRAGTASC